MSTAEALSHALSPGANLMCTERNGAVDYLIALGLVRYGDMLASVAGGQAYVGPFRDVPSLLVRVKLGQQQSAIAPLRVQLLALVKHVFERRGWRVHDRARASADETMQRFVDRLIVEFCFPDKCRKCSGRGFLYKQHAVVHVCASCQGTGVRPSSGAVRARALNIAVDGYRRVWEPRFETMLDVMGEIVGRTVGGVKARMNRVAK